MRNILIAATVPLTLWLLLYLFQSFTVGTFDIHLWTIGERAAISITGFILGILLFWFACDELNSKNP